MKSYNEVSEPVAPGNPSNKFVEEKMLITTMMKKIKDINDAVPLLKDIDKRLRE